MKQHPLLDDVQTNNAYDHLFREGRQRGDLIGLDGFDDLMSFKRKSTLYVYGPPYSGKSTFWHFCMVQLSHLHGWKHVIQSPETGEPSDIYAELTEMLMRSWFKEGYISPEKIMLAKAKISSHFLVVTGCTTPHDFLTAANESEAYFDSPPDSATCDPWNEFYHDITKYGGARDLYLENVLGDFREDARERNRLNVIITHPQNEEDKEKDGIRYQPPTRPNRIAGGQAWSRKGLNMMGVWRPPVADLNGNMLLDKNGQPFDENFVGITLDKVKPRELGKRGNVDLFFDFKKKCYFSKRGFEEVYPPIWEGAV